MSHITIPLNISNIKLLKARFASTLNVQINCTYASAAVDCFRSLHSNSNWSCYKKILLILPLVFCLYACFFSTNLALARSQIQEESSANQDHIFQNVIKLKQKSVYNVAYFEAGNYWEYSILYRRLHDALAVYPESKALVFPNKYHYSPGWGEKEKQDEIAASIMANPDIDIVLSMGTVASTLLAKHNNPQKIVLCLSIADAVFSKLINKRTHKSVHANFFVEHFPNKWRRTIELMNIMLDFHKIGTMSTNTAEGYAYCNIQDLKEVGRNRGFDVSFYDGIDAQETVESCKKGIEYLIEQDIDALYIPALSCFDPKAGNPKLLYDILHKSNIKTYAKDGDIPVMGGALMGISTLDYMDEGKTFAQILLRSLPNFKHDNSALLLEFKPKIFINSGTARMLGVELPLNLLTNVDSIYDTSLPLLKKTNTYD